MKPYNWETRDSGERESFDSGMVRDTQRGKPRFDLLFPEGIPYREQMITRFAALMERGADKYGERNWEKGNSRIEYERAVASALRHLIQWSTGENDEDHAAGVFFNIMQAETLKFKMETDINSVEIQDFSDEDREWAAMQAGETWRKIGEFGRSVESAPHVSIPQDERVDRCFEPCAHHNRSCHKEKDHSFRHQHDEHWWGDPNDEEVPCDARCAMGYNCIRKANHLGESHVHGRKPVEDEGHTW